MRTLRTCAAAGALLLLSALALAQSNDTPLNNGGDAVVYFSDPSVAWSPGVSGDLYWRAHTGGNMIDDVDDQGGSFMEIDGYQESLYDSDWSTTPHFYDRAHMGMVGLVPDLASYAAGTDGVTVIIGPSGFGSPCTVAPSICSPGGLCPATPAPIGWEVDIAFGATPSSGVVIPAGGLGNDDIATVWFVTGGMSVLSGPPGTCGMGDYAFQAIYSTDETQADLAGGINPSSGFHIPGSGLVNDLVSSMSEGHETWRGNVLNAVARTDGAASVELGDNGGGALNGRNLKVGGGTALLGVELRDYDGSLAPTTAFVAASLGSLANPGIPVLGGHLLILPGGLFNTTASLWSGPVASTAFTFTAEGAFASLLLPLPPTTAGSTLFLQGASFDGASLDTTNRISVTLAP